MQEDKQTGTHTELQTCLNTVLCSCTWGRVCTMLPRSADPCRRLAWSTNTWFYQCQLPGGTTIKLSTVGSRAFIYLFYLFIMKFVQLGTQIKTRCEKKKIYKSTQKVHYEVHKNHIIKSTSDSLRVAVAAPHIWNTLPTDIVPAGSLSTFRRLLWRFLFQQSYPDIIYWHSGPCSGCTT